MGSAGNRGVLQGSLQVLHIHVLFVAPLGSNHMAQSGAYQHEGRIAIQKTTHHSGTSANLPVQSLNNVVGADASPMFCRKIAVGKRFFSAILHLPGNFFQLHGPQFINNRFGFFSGSFLWMALSILATSFALDRGVTENTLR